MTELGRLRQIMEQWRGQEVWLCVQGMTLKVDPEYLDAANTNHAWNSKLSHFIKKKGNKSSCHHAKQNNYFRKIPEQFVFSAKRRVKQSKGMSFSEMAQQYSESRLNQTQQTRRKNKTLYHPPMYEFNFPQSPKCQEFDAPAKQFDIQQEVQLKIQESIQDLHKKNTYNKHINEDITEKLDNLKKQMLNRILEEDAKDDPQELTEIIDEIKTATEKILMNHSRKRPCNTELPRQISLNKGLFSFENAPLENAPAEKNLNVFESFKDMDVRQTQPKNEEQKMEIKLPQFKDDSSSLSSILSFNQLNNDKKQIPSKDSRNDSKVFAQDMKCQQSLKAENKQTKASRFMKQSKSDEIESIIEVDKPLQQEPTAIEHPSEQKKQQKAIIQEGNVTNYKIKFIENRVKQTEVIRLSPLRFRPKQEVVKHLVKHQIVEKQSNSIEFYHS